MMRFTAIGILLLTAPPVLAQDEGGLKPPPVEGALKELNQPTDSQAEVRERFRRVEQRLVEIDELLSDASAGETGKLASVSESGIAELLKRSRESSRNAVAEIDRILERIESEP